MMIKQPTVFNISRSDDYIWDTNEDGAQPPLTKKNTIYEKCNYEFQHVHEIYKTLVPFPVHFHLSFFSCTGRTGKRMMAIYLKVITIPRIIAFFCSRRVIIYSTSFKTYQFSTTRFRQLVIKNNFFVIVQFSLNLIKQLNDNCIFIYY